jgi:hypothetical protein
MWISDRDDDVVSQAAYTLSTIARWLEGAQAMVDAKVQDHISKLFNSQDPWVQLGTCWLVENLAGHEPIVPAILELNLLEQLMVLAR